MSDVKNDDPLLSVEEAVSYVRLSPATLARLRKDNAAPNHIKLGRRVLYRKSELDAFINANAVKSFYQGE